MLPRAPQCLHPQALPPAPESSVPRMTWNCSSAMFMVRFFRPNSTMIVPWKIQFPSSLGQADCSQVAIDAIANSLQRDCFGRLQAIFLLRSTDLKAIAPCMLGAATWGVDPVCQHTARLVRIQDGFRRWVHQQRYENKHRPKPSALHKSRSRSFHPKAQGPSAQKHSDRRFTARTTHSIPASVKP